MKLSDIMSSMQLSSYAEVALVLFLGAFGSIAISGADDSSRTSCPPIASSCSSMDAPSAFPSVGCSSSR